MAKVYIDSLKTMDASKDTTITFRWDGNQLTSNRLYIYKASDGTLVTTHDENTPRKYHILPANTLVNNTKYYFKLCVFDINGDESFSDNEYVKCIKTPKLSIINPVNKSTINDTSSIFVNLSYNGNDALKQYEVSLYNNKGVLIKNSGMLSDGELEYKFNLLNNGSYKLKARCVTVSGINVESAEISFKISTPNKTKYKILQLNNNNCEGYISYGTRIIFIGTDPDDDIFDYIDNKKIDLRNNVLSYISGFDINDDFSLILLAEQYKDDTIFLGTHDGKDVIKLSVLKYDNKYKVVLHTYSNGIVENVIYGKFTNYVPIGIKVTKKGGFYDLEVKEL